MGLKHISSCCNCDNRKQQGKAIKAGDVLCTFANESDDEGEEGGGARGHFRTGDMGAHKLF